MLVVLFFDIFHISRIFCLFLLFLSSAHESVTVAPRSHLRVERLSLSFVLSPPVIVSCLGHGFQ